MVSPENTEHPVIILVNPQMGENIGAAARSMLNFGLRQMRIVNPRDGWPNHKAEEMAKGALTVIEDAEIYPTLTEALHGVHRAYATTARSRRMNKPCVDARECGQEIESYRHIGQRSALVFGPERSGLENDHISLCDTVVSIPVSDAYPSLNLAQAVAITCYEWQMSAPHKPFHIQEKDTPATRDEVAALSEHLERELDASGFFKVAEKRPKMVQNLRSMLVRAEFTSQDISTLHGMIHGLNGRIKH